LYTLHNIVYFLEHNSLSPSLPLFLSLSIYIYTYKYIYIYIHTYTHTYRMPHQSGTICNIAARHSCYRIYVICLKISATSHWMQPLHSKITSKCLSSLSAITHNCGKRTRTVDYITAYASWLMGQHAYISNTVSKPLRLFTIFFFSFTSRPRLSLIWRHYILSKT
jgi:hypothetical protein